MRVPLCPLAMLALCFVAGCSSLDQKIAACVGESRFADARKLLDEEGLGELPTPSASPEGLGARAAFTGAIEVATEREISGLLLRGLAHGAHQLAMDRLQTCPWSAKLVATAEECRTKIAQIVAAEEMWSTQIGLAEPPIESVRSFLTEWTEKPSWCFDSDKLRALRPVAIEKLEQAAIASVEQSRGRFQPASRMSLLRDLQLVKVQQAEQQQLGYVLDILADMPLSNVASTERLSQQSLAALDRAKNQALGRQARQSGSAIDKCIGKCWKEVQQWIVTETGRILRLPDVTYDELSVGELWAIDPSIAPRLDADLSSAHVSFAGRLASHPLASTVALVHLSRARALGISGPAALPLQIEAVAKATRSATPRPPVSLRITCEKSVDPQLEMIVASALRSVLTSSAESLSELTPFAAASDQQTVTIHITRANIVFDTSGVSAVASSYLSHYQDVPNPRKEHLRRDCDWAESDVSRAKWSYDSAVSSHNIYPTQWSLNSVNSAYNNYVRAVDDYNFKVGLFNSTPSTTSEPVFMPYSFRQGTVRFGWQVGVLASLPGMPTLREDRESIASDFVRLGSKISDKSESQRRTDPLNIDLSADAGLNHLYEALRAIRDSLNVGLGKLAFETTATLAPEQHRILAWLHHPLGIQASLADALGVPKWASGCVSVKDLVGGLAKLSPPELQLAVCPATTRGALTAEAASALLGQFVCQTVASTEASVSTGTGTLIGRDGLVLTCAHVLSGPKLQVNFPAGPWRGRYDADVVFVNIQRDVAILRARGLRNEQWANVRGTPLATAGEPILAIGNSSMDVGGTNLGGVATGIVSNPMLERHETRYLSADISVASGSSGGPLFSLKDGSVVGVVQMVATVPGLGKDQLGVSSTGYLCLAAPTNLLREWLGLLIEEAK